MSDRRMLILVAFFLVFGFSGVCPASSIKAEHSGAPCLQCSNGQRIQTHSGSIPPYVHNAPKDHFVGISTPMSSLTEARHSAIDDAKQQILNVMGANYQHSHAEYLSGDAISGNVTRMVDDEFSNDSHGFLRQIENNIVDSHWSVDKSGNSVCFVLIRCSENMIRDMQRLSRGAMVIGKLVAIDENRVILELTECNDVCVTFVKATVSVTHLHKWAKAVTLFFWPIKEETRLEYEISVHPLSVCGLDKQITIDLGGPNRRIPFSLDVPSTTLNITLHGFDEIGRAVRVQMKSI